MNAYLTSWVSPTRRATRVVRVGDVPIGGSHPIVVQSMTTAPTTDTKRSVDEIERLVGAGCRIVRLTTPGMADVENLAAIKAEMKRRGVRVPLVADVHFLPEIALRACDQVEKVRVNPGNFADRKRFQTRDYTEAEYREELERVREAFLPIVRRAKENGTALRIGTNHGSLSDRIMNRFGDTPMGMVESALEFVRIAQGEGFGDVVISMKASNPVVMIQAYRLLTARMNEEGMDYPLHLGVTEAGEGEDGRIKSAMGIGALLADGLGDTIRVSLTEDSEREIPVAERIIAACVPEANPAVAMEIDPVWDPYSYRRRESLTIEGRVGATGGKEPVRVRTTFPFDDAEPKPDAVAVDASSGSTDPAVARVANTVSIPFDELSVSVSPAWGEPRYLAKLALSLEARPLWLRVQGGRDFEAAAEILATLPGGVEIEGRRLVRSGRRAASFFSRAGVKPPLHLRFLAGPDESEEEVRIRAAAELGGLLCDGIGDSVEISSLHGEAFNRRLAFNVLQAARVRMSKTEYIACPSCGRTLFDLQTTTARIRERTGHLKGLKIGIMGCIVNGPGEMADADFGYVGSGPGHVSLYVGRECVERKIPEGEAVERLVDLIRTHGRWVDPAS